MKCLVGPLSVVAFTLFLSTLGCGSHRQVQSIKTQSSGMTQFQFTATGTFSTSPTSVTPLAVDWYVIPGNVVVDPVTWVSYSLNEPALFGFLPNWLDPGSDRSGEPECADRRHHFVASVCKLSTQPDDNIGSPFYRVGR